jgi:alanine racemase
LAAAGEPEHKDFTQQQLEIFNGVLQKNKSKTFNTINSHITNTDALHNIPKENWKNYSHVRLGIGLYGINRNSEIETKEVLSLHARLIQIKKVCCLQIY